MPVCEKFPRISKLRMYDITNDVYEKKAEMGAPIQKDYTIGEVIVGDRKRVAIPIDKDTIGTFHSHTTPGLPEPSAVDVAELLSHELELQCIGSTGYVKGPRVRCYTPSKNSNTIKERIRALESQREKFRQYLKEAYKGKKGKEVEAALSEKDYSEMVSRDRAMEKLIGDINESKKKILEGCEIPPAGLGEVPAGAIGLREE